MRQTGFRKHLTASIALTVALVATGCESDGATDDGSARPSLTALDTLATPAGAFSGEPNLTATPDGVYLTWLERDGADAHALRFARWSGDGWSDARTITSREDLFVNWADFPSLTAFDGGTLAAHWLQKSGPGTYAYDVRVALSRDGGESWSESMVPHRDGVQAEHGFVSLLPMDGEVGLVWLDGRETVEGSPMTLRFTTLSSEGQLGEPTLLDASVCDCCQTGMAATSAGPIIVYRDRTEEEVRDISVVRRIDGEWTDPQTVHDDGWVIAGCPVNGPAVGARGERVAVAWFTGAPESGAESGSEPGSIREAGERGRVLAAFSEDGGATFSEPVRVDDGEAMGRVDLVLLDDGTALVTWLERVEGNAEVRTRHVDSDGVGSAASVAGTAAERASGFPHMAVHDDLLFFAWTEPGDGPRVRTATARLESAGAMAEASPEEVEPEPAPTLEAMTLDGDPVSLSDTRGDLVLLNVWATWCTPCRQEIPELQALYEAHADQGLRVVGVTVDSRSAEDEVRRFIDDFGMTYDIWWDPDQTAVSKFGAVGVPLTVLIDRQGRIAWRHIGAFERGDPELLRAVRSRLEPAATAPSPAT